MHRHLLLGFTLLLALASARGQQYSEAIEDNSYFIEEAYNQEKRVVQHITTAYYQLKSKDLVFSFTQEWPLGGQAHQLSLTIPFQVSYAGTDGLGDLSLNYRYQLWDAEDWAWVAPRISAILPTGSTSAGLGNGVVGVQACIPVSTRWSDGFVSHVNVGVTILPNVEGATSSLETVRRTLSSYFVGMSGIWLASPHINVLCEVLCSRDSFIEASGERGYSNKAIVSPGCRFAIDVEHLQIVPGLALPVTFSSDRTEAGIFAYLSFEHPF